jgi:undecaprenyl-diphosphatase
MNVDNIFQIIITAVVQGITEFLPISSSGHIFFVNELFSWKDINLTLMIAAHLGTLFAVIIYFWKDFKNYLIFGPLEFFKKKKTFNFNLFLNLVCSSIPLIIFGAFIKLQNINIYNSSLIAYSAIFFSLLLLYSDKNKTNKKLTDISFKDSFFIGILQIFALVPGSSRAGLCITGARFLGYNRISSAKYSMYLSIPAISGASFMMFFDIIKQNSIFIWIETTLVFFLSFLIAYFTISFFIKLLKKINFKIFVIYRILVAIIFLILFNFF